MIKNSDILTEQLAGLADGALIFSPENIRYFTGMNAPGSALIITDKGSVFITDKDHAKKARELIGDRYVKQTDNLWQMIRDILSVNNIYTLTIENDRLTISEYERLRRYLPEQDIISTSLLPNIIDSLRLYKDSEEEAKIIKAQEITDRAICHMKDFIKTGMTEKEILTELRCSILKYGADAYSENTSVSCGINTSMPYKETTDEAVKKGSFIIIEAGAVYKSYHACTSRTFIKGRPDNEQKKIYDTLCRAQQAMTDAVSSGVPAKDINAVPEEIIKAAGFSDCAAEFTGHGLGIELYEGPSISPYSKRILKQGNVFTVSASLYIHNKYGVKTEDTVEVTSDGHLCLTKSPKELMIL